MVFGPAGSEVSKLGNAERVVAHFFVSSYPFFESTLFFSFSEPAQQSNTDVQIYVYDCSGACVNQIQTNFGQQTCGVMEVDPLMESCKLEAGFKHAHIEVNVPQGCKVVSRMYSRSGACLMGEAIPLSERSSTFFPVLFSEDRAPFLGIVNCANRDAQVRCRLYFGKRSPEIQYSLPAQGSRLVSLLAEFSEYGIDQAERTIHGYVRVSTSSNMHCGVQLIESLKGEKGGYTFSSVS